MLSINKRKYYGLTALCVCFVIFCVGCTTQSRYSKTKVCTGINKQGAEVVDTITYNSDSGIITKDHLKAKTVLSKEKYPSILDKDVQTVAEKQLKVYGGIGKGVKYSNSVDGRTVVEELEIDYTTVDTNNLADAKLINIKDEKIPKVLNIKDTVSVYELNGVKCSDL